MRWTNEIQGFTAVTGGKDTRVTLDVSYETGRVQASQNIPLDALRRTVLRYFDVPPAHSAQDGLSDVVSKQGENPPVRTPEPE